MNDEHKPANERELLLFLLDSVNSEAEYNRVKARLDELDAAERESQGGENMEREDITTTRQAVALLQDHLDMVVCRTEAGWHVLTEDGFELSFDGDDELIDFARAERDVLAAVGGLGDELTRGAVLPSRPSRGPSGFHRQNPAVRCGAMKGVDVHLTHAHQLKGGDNTMDETTQTTLEQYLELFEATKQRVGDQVVALSLVQEIARDRRGERAGAERAARNAARTDRPQGPRVIRGTEPASQRQRNWLQDLGVHVPRDISRADASALIDEALAQQAAR